MLCEPNLPRRSAQEALWPAIRVHPGQMPAALQAELAANLRSRQLNPKFLYHSAHQAGLWLALHNEHAPDSAAQLLAALHDFAEPKRMAALSCGPAWKERAILETLGWRPEFVAVDVSVELLLRAIENIGPLAKTSDAFCMDVGGWAELPLADDPALFTFFGTVHNFVPAQIFGALGRVVRSGDWLLLSANLAPGGDYEAGVRSVLPQYDNPAALRWLRAFMEQRGNPAGKIAMRIEDCPAGSGLKRFAGVFTFDSDGQLAAGPESAPFRAGEELTLFFSYRHTIESVVSAAGASGFAALKTALAPSGEEAVFLLRKNQ